MAKLVNAAVARLGRLLAAHRKKATTLAIAFFVLKANKALSRRALNNGVSDKYDWSKEIVVITGGSSGIGHCVVTRLAARGIKVIILDLHPPPETHPCVHFFRCDITSREDLTRTGDEIVGTIGHPTILINNAGIVASPTAIMSKRMEDVTRVLAVNTTSHFLTTAQFCPAMIAANHGHVVTIASLAAFLTTPNVADYNLSKAAVVSFHESLGTELKYVHKTPRVRTSLVCPAYVKTPLHGSHSFGTSEKNPLLRDALEPDQVAKEIETVVIRGESVTVVVPWYLQHLMGSRGWSEWLFRAVIEKCALPALA